jgi:alkanesulfonate monooxygenase SsuD/methylene tetrahydromethanopterin reductase-like flavin-dependent oxidoreductase (luciferase family)
MRALWTEEEASYHGEHVSFGAAWAYPKPVQPHIPVVIGAGGGPRTFAWIAMHADGWMTTPMERDLAEKVDRLRTAWVDADRDGEPEVRVLATSRPTPELLQGWEATGVTEVIWGLPDRSAEDVVAFVARHAARLGLV